MPGDQPAVKEGGMDELAHVIGGRNCRVSRHLTVYTPRIHEIMEFGETLYFQVLNLFTR